MRQNGEDAQAQQVVAHVFEQAGVLHSADDVGVDGRGAVGLDHLALDLLAVDPHGELADRRSLGNRENVGRFELAIGVIAEGLLHLRDGNLFVDGDVDVVIDQVERGNGLVGGDQEAGGAGGSGAGQGEEESGYESCM